jgi:AcrR family transcriptional regulator
MTIPDHPAEVGENAPVPAPWTVAEPGLDWTTLSAAAKHERILCAAGTVFTRDGLDAPMPAVAAQAKAGIASLYRQFPSKRELVAALVTRRLEQIADAARTAAQRPGDRWTALTEMLWTIVERQSGDDFLGEAWAALKDHEDVAAATAEASTALDRLLADARQEGRLRDDATYLDLRLLFAATRAAKQVEPEAWQRMLALLIDALDTRPGD